MFVRADWSPVCGDQMALYNEILGEFGRLNAELLGISVDGVWCHLAFAQDRKLHFPLLPDFNGLTKFLRFQRIAGSAATSGTIATRSCREATLSFTAFSSNKQIGSERIGQRHTEGETSSRPAESESHRRLNV